MRGGEATMAGPGVPRSVVVEQPPGTAVLRLDGHDVARYVWQPELPLGSSPRPYLHPVRTLAGHTVTDAAPDSHPHQFGISVAAPDVDGRNFWGGRTFLAGHGPAWLDNHGTQRHQRWLRHTDTELAHTLHWTDGHHTTMLREDRSITCWRAGEDAWALSVRTQLTNALDRPLPIRSPAAHGRVGAGYGGFFWRGPTAAGAQVFSPTGGEVRAVHGGTAAWVAVTAGTDDHNAWTMLFVPGDERTARDRWFVRARDYLGVGSSLTWDEPLTLAPDQTITRRVIAVVVDGALSTAAAADLAATARRAA